MAELSSNQIGNILDAATAKAVEIGSPSSIAIVDSGRNLLAFRRMDGALLASIEISQNKAYTARSLNMKTSDVTEFVQPGAPLYGMENSHRNPLVIFGGGEPISVGSEIVGAIGVAGGTVPDDESIAEAGAAAVS